jgi:hypothetical protein
VLGRRRVDSFHPVLKVHRIRRQPQQWLKVFPAG